MSSEPVKARGVRVFDGHSDLLSELYYSRSGGEAWFEQGGPDGHIDLPRLRASVLAGGIFAIFARGGGWSDDMLEPRPNADGGYRIPDQPPIDPGDGRADAFAQVALALRLIRSHPDFLTVVRTAMDLDRAAETGRIGIVLHLEGAEPIGPELVELDVLHAAGVRSVGLVWSRPNRFGHGVPFRFPSSSDIGPGLTPEGCMLVDRCNELGMLIDLAHLNERGFWDVADRSSKPLVVSHAAVQALCPSSRNLTDAQLDRIGASGGLVGVNFNVRDLRPDGRNDPRTPLSLLAEHIEYIAERIGVDHVGFGSDLDGATMPEAIRDVSGFGAVIECLYERGHDAPTIEKIAHANWRRIIAATLG